MEKPYGCFSTRCSTYIDQCAFLLSVQSALSSGFTDRMMRSLGFQHSSSIKEKRREGLATAMMQACPSSPAL
jgi:hypothetical protein